MYHYEFIGAIICISLGWLSGFWMSSLDLAWYHDLVRPAFSPPNWLFAPVWSALYLMIGIVGGKLWKMRKSEPFLTKLFFLQLVCNIIWNPLFFTYRRIDLACYDILILLATLYVMLCLLCKHTHKTMCILWVPYVLWVSFATVLNVYIFIYN